MKIQDVWNKAQTAQGIKRERQEFLKRDSFLGWSSCLCLLVQDEVTVSVFQKGDFLGHASLYFVACSWSCLKTHYMYISILFSNKPMYIMGILFSGALKAGYPNVYNVYKQQHKN